MNVKFVGALSLMLLPAVLVTASQAGSPQTAAADPTAPHRAAINRYCTTCHNEKAMIGNLDLTKVDLAHFADNPVLGEKIVRKLRAGMMPPTGSSRPDAATREALISWMEGELDRAVAAAPQWPAPGLHRLNRAEYANAVRELLDLEVDASKFLPSDDSSHGFDNMAGTLTVSPALIEALLSAAGKISRIALGNVTAPTQTVYEAPTDTAQNGHIEGLPFGTRGGMLVKHQFPADAEYIVKVLPIAGYFKAVLGGVTGEKLEVIVDGERVKLFDWDKEIGTGGSGKIGETPRISIKAGPHTIGVAFLATNEAPGNDINKPFARTMNSPGQISGYLFYPHVGQIQIEGPYTAQVAGDSPSRRKIFVCKPATTKDEPACAREIVTSLARRAFRRTPSKEDIATLMQFYDAGRKDANFDAGVEAALQRILADPQFVYRGEVEATNVTPGKTYTLKDEELASRLSFFLWSSIPDNELLLLAEQGKLKDPKVLQQQVQRMLKDNRASSLIANFTGQWLNVRKMQAVEPVVNLFPDFDNNLREAFRREVELFFASIVQEDRSILDLVNADYTFLNERLARHYGIPNVYGSQFRRVTLGPEFDMRRGLMGKGALLTVTSQAARTSPVNRGQWFLQTFLGISAPDPPPNVPGIKEAAPDTARNTKELTMRQRMAQHQINATCSTCHMIFEPLGLAMENFDPTGAWRTDESGTPIDTAGKFVDGTPIDGPASLRNLVIRYSDQFARNVTEKLLTYALGRGIEPRDMPLVRKIVREAAADNYRLSTIVNGIVRSTPFQMNMKPTAQSAANAREAR